MPRPRTKRCDSSCWTGPLKALETDAADGADTYRLRAQILVELGRPAEATAQYELAVRAQPADLTTRSRLANLLLDQGRADEALEHARWCARMQPESAAYRRLLERIHQRLLTGVGS